MLAAIGGREFRSTKVGSLSWDDICNGLYENCELVRNLCGQTHIRTWPKETFTKQCHGNLKTRRGDMKHSWS
jgi:hypothetical protein